MTDDVVGTGVESGYDNHYACQCGQIVIVRTFMDEYGRWKEQGVRQCPKCGSSRRPSVDSRTDQEKAFDDLLAVLDDWAVEWQGSLDKELPVEFASEAADVLWTDVLQMKEFDRD